MPSPEDRQGDGFTASRAAASGAAPAPWWRSSQLRDGLFLAVLAVSVLLLGNFAVVRTLMQPRTHMLGIGVAAQVGAIHDAYRRLPPAQRDAWLQDVVAGSHGGLQRMPQGPASLVMSDNVAETEAMRVVQDRLPGIQVGFAAGDGPHVWFALPQDDGKRVWLRMMSAPAADRTGRLLAAWGSSGVLVVLCGLALIGWRQQRRLRGAGQALAQVVPPETGASLPPAPPALPGAAAAPPPDLPDVRSLEELVRVMSSRMHAVERQRNEAMLGVARELRTVLAQVPQACRQAPPLVAFERLAGQFEAFAQPEAQAARPLQPVDLNAVVERRTRHAPAGVTLGLAPLPPLPLRPQAMECLVDNLLGNALSHGGGQAVLTTAEDGDWVVLRVLDRGEPLADDELALMGRPFYRTDAARAQGVAAGLGLALARHVAQLHGGELRVLRREGGGLAVEVRLPRPQEEAAARPARAPRRPLPGWVGLLGDIAGLTVLCIGALALGLTLLSRTVIDPNMATSSRIWTSILGGMTSGYLSLPAPARPAYLEDLRRYSDGLIEQADPAQYTIGPPLLSNVATTLEALRQALPDLPLDVSPLPDSALWVHLPAAPEESAGPWLRMRVPLYSQDIAYVLLGLVLLVAASAGFLALRARRRLDWAAQALREGRGDLPAQARAHGGNQALVDSLMAVRQRFGTACQRLAQAKEEQEWLLARLLQDLQVTLASLRESAGRSSPALAACADPLQHAFDGLVRLAMPPDRGAAGVTQVNTLLTALPLDPAVAERQAVRWSLCGVPYAALGEDDARRLFVAVLNYLMAQQPGALEISSGMENGWVVVRFTEQGGRTQPGAAAQALMLTCHFAESRGGFMRFGQAPGAGGAQVEVLLPPARLS